MKDVIANPDQNRDRGGRPAATSPHELAEAAQKLFLAQGFEQTSVDDIAAAAGVSRRTFFRYFATKADVLWVESGAEFTRLHDHLASSPPGESCRAAIIRAALAALRFPPEQRDWALHRAQLVVSVPAVQAQASVRFEQWRTSAARFAAERYGQAADDLLPLACGHALLAGSLTAHQYWITHPDTDLFEALEQALDVLLPRDPG